MMGNWTDHNSLQAELHMREIRAMAAEARRARQARPPRPLRRQVGGLLIAAGQRLAR